MKISSPIDRNIFYFSLVYLSTGTDISQLSVQPGLRANLQQLVDDHAYVLATDLAHMPLTSAESVDERRQRLDDIRRRHAVWAFARGDYDRAFDLCAEVECGG